jgi:hypothetical protein
VEVLPPPKTAHRGGADNVGASAPPKP